MKRLLIIALGFFALLNVFFVGCGDFTSTHSWVQSEDSSSTGSPSSTGTSQKYSKANVRRLSVVELRNSICDVFQLKIAEFPMNFSVEATQGEFDNIYEDLTVTTSFLLALQTSAEWAAQAASAKLNTLLPCDIASKGELACATAFVDTFGLKLFRRPLTADERTGLISLYSDTHNAEDHATSVATVIEAMILSPHFLYRTELGTQIGSASALTPYEVASAMSYFLWQSTPDATLLEAAKSDQLQSSEQLAAQAQRLLSDARAGQAAKTLFMQWFGLEQTLRMSKPDAAFSPALANSMDLEVRQFLDNKVWSGTTGFLDLFTSADTWIDVNLARIYGAPAPSGQGFSPYQRDPQKHAGLLTTPAFIATHSPGDYRSPIQLGHFVRTSLFCQFLSPAPPGVPPAPADPNLDVRARFSQHSSDKTCQSCHQMMDPIGYGWSQFDPIGRWVPVDHGVTEDGSGELRATDVDGNFMGVAELGRKLVGSEQVRRCFAAKVLSRALGRDVVLNATAKFDDSGWVSQLRASGYIEGSLQKLFAAVVTSPQFRTRDTASVPEGGVK